MDSHPDVLYRHEPDEIVPPRPDMKPCRQLREWVAERGLSAAGKTPFFPKSWLPGPLALLRNALACSLKGAARLPVMGQTLSQVKLPDFVRPDRHPELRVAIKLVNWDASAAARALPDSRCLFILRHPCGQIASTLNGAATGRFRSHLDGTGAPVDIASAAVYAASHGVSAAAFEALPAAAKFAWSWRAFNETALNGLAGLPNARIVLYEDLCLRPETVARDLFAFAGLAWNPQTAAFIAQSTTRGDAKDYYAVFRSSTAQVARWRDTMDPGDQEAVRAVMRDSRLAECWPDLRMAA
jgi:hypothetical protein